MRETYGRFGIDLPRFNGGDSWTLPLPARYIVSPGGIIRHAEVGTDYTIRPETEETVSLLRELQTQCEDFTS